MKRQFVQLLARVVMNAVGLFAASLLLSGIDFQGRVEVLFVAALVLSVINALIKPLAVILSLPALLLTLGIFSVVINGFMVYLAHLIYPPFQVSGFWTALLAGIVVGLVNYILTRVLDSLAPEETKD